MNERCLDPKFLLAKTYIINLNSLKKWEKNDWLMQNNGLGMEYENMCEDGRPVGAGSAGDATAPADFGI